MSLDDSVNSKASITQENVGQDYHLIIFGQLLFLCWNIIIEKVSLNHY